MEREALNFVIEREEQPVVISGEDYVLIELDGKKRDTYLNDLSARLRISPMGKPAGIKDFINLQSGLLSMSLKKVVGGERVAVDKKPIQAWPASTISGLFEAAKNLSGLGNDEDADDADAGAEKTTRGREAFVVYAGRSPSHECATMPT